MSHDELLDTTDTIYCSRPLYTFSISFEARLVEDITACSTEKLTSMRSRLFAYRLHTSHSTALLAPFQSTMPANSHLLKEFKSAKSEHDRLKESVKLSLHSEVETLKVIKRLKDQLENEESTRSKLINT